MLEKDREILEKYFKETDLITDQKIIEQMNKGYSMFDQALSQLRSYYLEKIRKGITLKKLYKIVDEEKDLAIDDIREPDFAKAIHDQFTQVIERVFKKEEL